MLYGKAEIMVLRTETLLSDLHKNKPINNEIITARQDINEYMQQTRINVLFENEIDPQAFVLSISNYAAKEREAIEHPGHARSAVLKPTKASLKTLETALRGWQNQINKESEQEIRKAEAIAKKRKEFLGIVKDVCVDEKCDKKTFITLIEAKTNSVGD